MMVAESVPIASGQGARAHQASEPNLASNGDHSRPTAVTWAGGLVGAPDRITANWAALPVHQ
jgi:hypothetical protein